MTGFRFSPNPNQAHQINWLPWGQEAFARAQGENRPVLLCLSAVWCHWCHVMDEATYSDPDVVRFINQGFVAIRADSDHRPDLNSRYNVGGWPTTALLTGHGGLIGGATYLPPDQLLAMLTELDAAYRDDKAQLYDQARQLLHQRRDQARRATAGHEVEEALVDRVARIVTGAYDVANGGFGTAPKFPNTTVLTFLSHLSRTTGEEFYRVMLEKTLDRMADGHLFDNVDGGFFRHCAASNWTEPQLEKLLEDNIGLAQVYLNTYLLTDNDNYLQVASQTIDYLMSHLFSDAAPGFRGSQGAHSEYFDLPLEARLGQPAPPVDPSFYTSSNAQAVSMLMEASWRLRRPDLAQSALRVLAPMEAMVRGGQLSHVYSEAGPSQGPSFLVDWASLLRALLSAHQHTGHAGYLEQAKDVAVGLLDRFLDHDKGGFFDIEEDPAGIGLLAIREKPLPDNVAAALAMLQLQQATQNADYREVAEATLSSCIETYRGYGEFAASFGLAVHLLRNQPVEVTIEGRPLDESTMEMLRAAARLDYPNLEIKPVQTADAVMPAMAHVYLDTLCLPPVSDPGELSATVSGALTAQASPFENILDRLSAP